MIQNLVLLLSLLSLNLRRIEDVDETTIDLQARIKRLEGLLEDLNAKLAVNQTSETAAKERATTVETTKIAADEKDGVTSDDSAREVSTEPMTTQTKASETQVMTKEESCDISFNGTCYWTHIEDDWIMKFPQAESICSNKASIPAYFPNEKVYNRMVEHLRSKISYGSLSIYMWTGVNIDTNTGDITHPSEDTYVKWYPDYPRTGGSYESHTHVTLNVKPDPDFAYQGMYNGDPEWNRNGVICQKTIG